MSDLAFIGLGAMGAPMALNLARDGLPLRVHNRTPARAGPLIEAGAELAASPADAVRPGGVVFTMLADDAALDAVTSGEHGFIDRLGAGGLHVSLSTVAPETSRRLAAAHAAHGSLFVAAPVFGRPDAAAARKLWICMAGVEAAKQRAAPLLERLGQSLHDFGTDPGAVGVLKLAGNFMIMAAIEAMAEAQALAAKSGLDRKAVAEFFGSTVFGGPIYRNYGRVLAEGAYTPAGFSVDLGLKDMRLVRGAAEAVKVPMPIGDLLRARLVSAQAKGRSAMDWSVIALASTEDAGI
jgi:3-hydroxyisobutyrate dehydrogenase-like beta-hydroxyacid dehydrogenase